MVKVEVYYEDLEEIWQYWDVQDSFTLEEFDRLLHTN